MTTKFIIYGLMGFIMEILWTGVISLLNRDFTLRAYTYLWMFPIYGLAVFMEPVYQAAEHLPFVMRGIIYMSLIFCAEYLAGFLLERGVGKCPWDYSGASASVYGFIRLDYAPVWFSVGLFYEFIYFNLFPLIM